MFALLFLLTAPCAMAQVSVQALDDGWRFHLLPGDEAAKVHPQATAWHAARVPGAVQTGLLAADLIDDPFKGDHEAALQWIGLADWEYERTLHVDAATLARRHVDLVFEGLDTFAEVYVNGTRVLMADNMFRRWRVHVKAHLHVGDNALRVVFHSPIRRVQSWLSKRKFALPGAFDSAFGDEPEGRQSANYVRKAAYQYGWDWGPRYVTEGLWKPVRLEGWDGPRLTDFHVAQEQVDAKIARLSARFELVSDAAAHVHARVIWRAPDGHHGEVERSATLAPGSNVLDLPIDIAQPQRWWPAGYGAPDLYRFHAEVIKGTTAVATLDRDIGLRSVELRRTRDHWGRGFALVVNGVPVFAKGANLIPFDSFPSRATPARERALLQAAHDANMNLLRVWGGGIYPDDAFFKEADRLGLMIWQDFMFGGAIPPHDEAFRANVEVEARQQVRQLRDHASLVLWCGNNEIATAWDSWGQREKMLREAGAAETARIDAGLHALFDHTLREVVAQESPDVPYWPSSPDSSADDAKANDPNDGDYHAWDVWSGSAPIAHYLKVTPRFQSEYGLQSFPALATLRDFAAPAELDADSRVMRAHQKFDHGNGNIRLLHYVRGNYGDPRDFADLVYLSQVMQAEGIELAADHLRSAAPRSMGSLYWQLNDVWPGITWSSIDYDGRWKALHYHARRFYAPLRLVAIRDGGATRVWLVSDRGDALAGRLDVRVMDFEGRVYSHRSDVVRAAARASTHVLTLDDAALLHGADPRRRMAVFEWRVGGRVVSRRLVFFRPPRKLALPQPALQVALRADDRGTVLDITAKRLAREVWIDFGDLDVRPSDDAFDLLPGEHRQVRLTTRVDIATLRRALQVRSLADAIWPAHKAATP